MNLDMAPIIIPIAICLLYLVSPFLLNFFPTNKSIKQIRKLSQKILWLYCSLLPTLFLIQIRLELEVTYSLVFVLPLILQLFSLKSLFKTEPSGTASIKLVSSKFHSSKLMEYFVTLILPFITLSNENKDKLTIILVLLIIILVFWKLKIFYLNFPILIFYYIHEVTLNDNQEYYLISKKEQIEINVSYNIVTYDEQFKIAILLDKE